MSVAAPKIGAVACATTLIALTSLPAFAAPAETAEGFVRRVYARYRATGPGVIMARPHGAPFYTAAFLDAVAKDSEAEGTAIDWDPICACQDYKIRVRSVVVSKKDDSTIEARVAFVNLGSPNTVTLILSQTSAGWRIADVGNKGIESVVALLMEAKEQSTRKPQGTKPF